MVLTAFVLAAALSAHQGQQVTESGSLGSLGIAAYERGDYATALTFLTNAVYDSGADNDPLGPLDPWSAVYLARMFNLGEGVNQDRTLSCALFSVAARETESRFHDQNAVAKFTRILGVNPCDALPESAAAERNALMSGCFLPGITRTEFTIEGGIGWVDRTGIHLRVDETSRDEGLADMSRCHFATLPITHSAVTVERGSRLVTRDFLQFFTWKSSRPVGHIVRELQWHLVEVSALGTRVAVVVPLGQTVDVPFPSLDAAVADHYGVELRAAAGGKVEWLIRDGNRRGLID